MNIHAYLHLLFVSVIEREGESERKHEWQYFYAGLVINQPLVLHLVSNRVSGHSVGRNDSLVETYKFKKD